MSIKSLLAIIVAILLIANLVVFALGKISPLLFWVIIILGAIAAWWVIPKLP